jgi:transcriptional regulator with XRE-family HTH domain
MPESFGARLRQRREQQRIDLSTIAKDTKIKLSLLEALERDDVSHLPSGIFRRAFIRAYALAVGLAPDAVVREFQELYPDPDDIVEELAACAADREAASATSGPPMRLRYLMNSAIGSLSRRRSAQPRNPDVAALQVIEDVPEQTASPANAALSAALDAIRDAAAAPHASAQPEPDWQALADLCTALGRVDARRDVAPLLQDAGRMLNAVGLIVWVWDPEAAELMPVFGCGYPEPVLGQLRGVKRDANNPTAAAFRTAQPVVVNGSDLVTGALVVPLLASTGCAGVLAIELRDRAEERALLRAMATILAAQLAALIGTGEPARARMLA